MRNKFIYSYCIKIHALGFDKLLESTFCLLLVVEGFSLQKTVLARGQVNIVNEAKLNSPICSASEAVVWDAVRCCQAELDPFRWPMLAAGIAVFSASHQFAEHTSRVWWFCWDSESCSGSARQATSDPDLFFGASLALELLLRTATELVVTSYCIKSTFSGTSQSDQEMVCFVVSNKTRQHFKMMIF